MPLKVDRSVGSVKRRAATRITPGDALVQTIDVMNVVVHRPAQHLPQLSEGDILRVPLGFSLFAALPAHGPFLAVENVSLRRTGMPVFDQDFLDNVLDLLHRGHLVACAIALQNIDDLVG